MPPKMTKASRRNQKMRHQWRNVVKQIWICIFGIGRVMTQCLRRSGPGIPGPDRPRRIILVRSSFNENGYREISPYDCLGLTDSIDSYNDYVGSISTEPYGHLDRYRSDPFKREYVSLPRFSHPLFRCYVAASESLFFLVPQDLYPKSYRALYADNIYHWWCQTICPVSGDVIIHAATSVQFDDTPLSATYYDEKKTGLIGWEKSPSNRTDT